MEDTHITQDDAGNRTPSLSTVICDALEEPAFLDDDGLSLEIPRFISVGNAYSLYGLKDDETVLDAMIRRNAPRY
jgi:adenine-specific DNA-methyltransferase